MNTALAAVAASAAVFAVLAVLQRNLYASALCLLAVLMQVAAFFFLLGAQLLGLMQVLLYAGGVMILVVIAIAASGGSCPGRWTALRLPWRLAGLVLAAPLVELASLWRLRRAASPCWLPVTPGLEREMAALLFGPYALLLEAVGVLILVAATATVRDRA